MEVLHEGHIKEENNQCLQCNCYGKAQKGGLAKGIICKDPARIPCTQCLDDAMKIFLEMSKKKKIRMTISKRWQQMVEVEAQNVKKGSVDSLVCKGPTPKTKGVRQTNGTRPGCRKSGHLLNDIWGRTLFNLVK